MAQEPDHCTQITATTNDEGVVTKFKVVDKVIDRPQRGASNILKTKLGKFASAMPFVSKSSVDSLTKLKTRTIQLAEKPEGICFGMTVLWLKGYLLGGHTAYSANVNQASIVHGQYTVKGRGTGSGKAQMWQSRKDTFDLHGMVLDDGDKSSFFGNAEDACDWLRGKSGAFSVKVPGHALAVIVVPPKVYYFDPNWGVYEYANFSDFIIYGRSHIKWEYCTTGQDPAPSEVFVLPVKAG